MKTEAISSIPSQKKKSTERSSIVSTTSSLSRSGSGTCSDESVQYRSIRWLNIEWNWSDDRWISTYPCWWIYWKFCEMLLSWRFGQESSRKLSQALEAFYFFVGDFRPYSMMNASCLTPAKTKLIRWTINFKNVFIMKTFYSYT